MFLLLPDDGEDRDVAVKLSRYYAYLIVFVEELLPYYVEDTRELKMTVTKEVKILASSCTPSEMCKKMKCLPRTKEEKDNPKTIFDKGLKLGKQLEKMHNTRPQLWNMIAEFWAETIIYITPSHATAKHHMKHLESGEFLTHIWVLLSHAGILNLDREKDQGSKPAQTTAETA